MTGHREHWIAFSLLWTGFLLAEEPADPFRPPAVHVEGVPAIPPDLWEELKRYQDIRSARFLDWEPSGQGMLVASRRDNLVRLYRVREPGAAPEQLTDGDEPVESGRFLLDGALLFSRARGGDENDQLILLDRDSRKEALLTDGKSRNLFFEIHSGGKIIPFSSTRRNGQDADLYFIDLEKKSRPPFPALHDLYAGKGSAAAVLAEAEGGGLTAEAKNENLFYAHYYLGKYHQARREREQALAHLEEAPRHPISHFMAACARIDLKRLRMESDR